MTAAGKRWLVFICAAILLQGVVLLFCTESGLMFLYPAVVRLYAENLNPRSNSYVAYYDMRIPVSEASIVAVGMDFSVAQSYDAFLHIFRFIKQYSNVQTIYIDDDNQWAESIAERMEYPLEEVELPSVLVRFADNLQNLNDTYSPQRKFTVCTMPEGDSFGEEPVVLLMDRDQMMEPDTRAALEAAGAVCLEMKYIRCSADSGMRNDMELPLPGKTEGFSFVSAQKIDWFYRYYRTVTRLFFDQNEIYINKLETASADFVLLITNGTRANLQEQFPVSE